MGIKEQREARREKLFSEFVSVEGLIEYLATQEGLDISDVAAELEGLIKRSDNLNLPEYGAIDEAAIEFVPYSAEQSRLSLMEMLDDTIMGCGHGDASDHHGWLRDDLFPFLQSHGLDVPMCLPSWEPSLKKTDDEGGKIDIDIETVRPVQIQQVESKIFSRLMDSLANFPDRFPNYTSKSVRLEKGIQNWLINCKLASNTREAMIFSQIIAEHFKL